MFFITILGLLLRLICIDKPEGLWNDEYVSWYISSIPFGSGFFDAILKQCHLPLYYFYLKPFAGCSDIVLRLTSLLPNVISIPVMYLAGKEFSKKTGYFSASITAVLSFLVYYSLEVRFYSLLFLFSALSVLFTLKLIKKYSARNLAGWIISSILIMLTHVLGIIYVFFNLIYVLYKTKKLSKNIIFLLSGCFAITILFGINIIKMLPSSQWWGHFSYTNILFLFSDYFSPVLTNKINAPPVFFYNREIIFPILLPTIIGVCGMIFGIKKEKGLAIIALLTVITLSVIAITGQIVFITKYSIEILPALILLTSAGFISLKKIGSVLFGIFVAFHLLAIFSPFYVTKMPNTEGHKLAGDVLNAQNPDSIIFTYYSPDRFKRYTDFSGKKLYSIDKKNRFEYSDNPSKIFDNIKSGEKVSVVILNSVAFFDDDFIEKNRNNPNIPEMFITFSAVKNSLLKSMDKDFKDYSASFNGDWLIITAVKK